MRRPAKTRLERFLKGCEAAVLIETMIAVPVATIFAAGVLEFGNIFWQRQQMQIGVRDAARYWARCRPSFSQCDQTIARNLAFYGNPMGTGNPRVPGWTDVTELVIEPATPPAVPDDSSIVRVTGTLNYQGSPFFWVISDGGIAVEYRHEERYIGW